MADLLLDIHLYAAALKPVIILASCIVAPAGLIILLKE